MLRAPLRRFKESSDNMQKGAAKLTTKPTQEPLKQINVGQIKNQEKNNAKPAALPSTQPAQGDSQTKVKLDNHADVELRCIELADDIYRYLVNHEKKFILDEGFLNGGEPTIKMRRILVDWLVQVHIRFHLLPETLHLSISILDHMLAKKLVGKSDLQLLGVGSVFVASKYEEVFLPDVYDYQYITEDTYTKKDILQMEQLILNTMQFDLSCPSSLVFGRCLSRLITDNATGTIENEAFYYTYNMSKYFGELALLDNLMSSIRKSHIAMASMSISLRLCPVNGIDVHESERLMRNTFGASQKELSVATKLLAFVAVKQLKQNKLLAIKQKYQSTRLGQVSNLIDQSKIEMLERIAQ